LIDAYPNSFAVIEHHFIDNETPWGLARANYYQVIYVPWFMHDGLVETWPIETYESLFLARQQVTTPVVMEVGAALIEGHTYEVQLRTSLEPSAPEPLAVRTYAVLVEDYYPAYPSYSRNGFRTATDTADFTLAPGESRFEARIIELPGDANVENLRIIAWAQMPEPLGPAEVYQAAKAVWPFGALGEAGACCLPSGGCAMLSAAGCVLAGGLQQGLVDCAAVQCPQPGACCLAPEQGLCQEMLAAHCTALAGTFHGENSPCEDLGPLAGHALHFDGVAGAVQVPHAPALSFAAGQALTLEAWVRPDFFDDVRMILAKDADGLTNYSFRVDEVGKLQFYYRDAANTTWFMYATSTAAVALGQWSHVAVTHVFGAGENIRLYINGQPVAGEWTTPPSDGPYQGTGDLLIGAGLPDNLGDPLIRVFPGEIDEARIWNVVRSGSEISANMTVHVSSSPDLVACWRLDEGHGTSAGDQTGAHDGTLLADAAWIALDACAPPTQLGDLNCDGVVDFEDINAFVLALGGQGPYEAQYPMCQWLNADCNGDGSVNFDDINAFVALLGG
jgi:hypothetical protein